MRSDNLESSESSCTTDITTTGSEVIDQSNYFYSDSDDPVFYETVFAPVFIENDNSAVNCVTNENKFLKIVRK